MTTDIDVGSAATDRALSEPPNTFVCLENPANDSGLITQVEIWGLQNLPGCKVGTFYGTPPDFTSRDWVSLGTVAAGAKRTFTGLSVLVQSGDYIGVYFSGGQIKKDGSGYLGMYWKAGDQFDQGEQTYAKLLGDTLSLYAAGYTTKRQASPLPMFYRKE